MNSHLAGFDLRLFLKNMLFFSKNDVKEQLIEQRLMETFNTILSYSESDPQFRMQYSNEIDYLKHLGHYSLHPSQRVISSNKTEAIMDKKLGMPYITHKGRRLYYPKSYTLKDAENAYHNIVETDGILGTDIPGVAHQYQDETYRINIGDILLDVGCAEALFTLDNIDLVSKAILIECNSEWITALKATFAPFNNKVKIINKMVKDHNSRNTIKLSSLLNCESHPVFIKMDIEGLEVTTIKTASEFLCSRSDITISCCTYHRNGDAETLAHIFDDIGYNYRFSNGYMLFARYDMPQYPFFRRGVIRARKKNG